MQRRQSEPSFEDEPGRDDFLFLSAMPWVSFTGVQHAMHLTPADSVPRIVWGKYYQQEGRTFLPVSVQVHHALVNGLEIGRFFAFLEEKFQKT
jgi:chloramphenicol O-acetyltransferase type A